MKELYEIYCNEIFDEGLDDIDFNSENFVSTVIDNSILLAIRGWLKNDDKLTYEEFCEKMNSDDTEFINKDGPFSHQKLTFKERWS